jgi:hypothetical protein
VSHTLNVDEAVAQFAAILREELGAGADADAGLGPVSGETLAEAEARRFRTAGQLLRLVCPDPSRCSNQRCRRTRLCRHVAEQQEQQGRAIDGSSRRTPGAEALRHAIWLFMNSDAARDGAS